MNKLISRLLPIALLLGLAFTGSGCASILHGGSRSVTINSDPAGAKVRIVRADNGWGVHNGVTPLTVSLPPRRGYFKGQSYNVKIEMEGYQTVEVAIRPTLSGWYLGNVIFGGLIGMIVVDPLTGSMWNLSPDRIERTLSPSQAQLIKERNGFLVVLHSELSEAEKAGLVRIN